MAIQDINTGIRANDGTGESIKSAFDKINANFDYLEGESIPAKISAELANINSSFVGGEIAGATTITDPTNSNDSATGCLVLTGGLGVGGDANFAYRISAPTMNTVTLTAASATINSLSIDAIDGTPIGATIPSEGNFTSLTVTDAVTLGAVSASSVTSTGDYSGLNATLTGSLTALNISAGDGTFTGIINAPSIAVSGDISAEGGTFSETLSVDNLVSESGIGINNGNMLITLGNIILLDGRVTSSQSVAGYAIARRMTVGQAGGSGDPLNPNFAEIYTNDGRLIISTAPVPTSATDTGEAGEIRIGEDSGTTYLYVCTATDTWVRTAFATW